MARSTLLDSGAPGCGAGRAGEISTSCSAEPYYASLYQYIHHVDPAAFVVVNPGTAVNACFLSPGSMVANIFVSI